MAKTDTSVNTSWQQVFPTSNSNKRFDQGGFFFLERAIKRKASVIREDTGNTNVSTELITLVRYSIAGKLNPFKPFDISS